SCLKDVYSQFEQAIDLYQDFWDMMAEIDTKTWVLEPDNPMFGATERRIAVNTTASLQISVDPRRPTMLPECRFMGADQVVQPLREAMNTNLNFWNEQDSLLRNLERLLGVSFPSPSNTKKEEFSVECGICYAYRLDEEIPDNACNDTRCGQPFHQSCLYELTSTYFKSYTNKTSMNGLNAESDPYNSHQVIRLGSLKGKVVWIVGASSGIGEALAYRLAQDGCILILSSRREDRLKQVSNKCLEYGTIQHKDILVLPLDMLDYKSHVAAMETVIKYFKKIDILVNNAGRSQRALWEKTSLEVDRQMLNTNVLGPLSITKAVLPHFIQQKSGHVVVTSSLAGKFGSPGLGSYSGSKHALQGWFDALRIEGYEYNINVTMVCPGPVFSEALQHAFTENEGQILGVDMKPGENRMPAERCAALMAVAMANNMDEVWITRNPELFYTYLFQYCPAIARRFVHY
ncbi:hypothetical protein FSP39_014840, partial [Pinctada imbricata]